MPSPKVCEQTRSNVENNSNRTTGHTVLLNMVLVSNGATCKLQHVVRYCLANGYEAIQKRQSTKKYKIK